MKEIALNLDLHKDVPESYKNFKFNIEEDCRLTAVDLKYSHNKRYSAQELIANYCNKITAIHDAYTSSLNDELMKLTSNLPAAYKMDEILGTQMEQNNREIDSTEKVKSGNICPFLNCNKPISKARRHLETMHGQLEESVVNYAVQVAKHLSINKCSTKKTSNTRSMP